MSSHVSLLILIHNINNIVSEVKTYNTKIETDNV